VGKSLEDARMEVVETHLANLLAKHKKKFLQIKEAELMQTQMMEAGRLRRTDETDRRNLQQRTAKNQRIWAEQKVIAREMSKRFLMLFKRDSLQLLVDEGILKRPYDASMDNTFIPELYGQVEFDLLNNREFRDNLDSLFNWALREQSKSHKTAVKKEYTRRDEKKREELRAQKEKEDAKKKRKEERAAARERFKI
jgi:hypothetical protein